jgi:hypothetical protein
MAGARNETPVSLKWLTVLAVCCSWAIGHAQPAMADERSGSHGIVHVSTNTNGLWTGVREAEHGELHGTSVDIGPGLSAELSGESSLVDEDTGAGEVIQVDNVLFEQFCTGVNWSGACLPTTDLSSNPVVAQAPALGVSTPSLTTDAVTTAFRELPLPASELVVEPPKGRTLVNFDTNFYTDQPAFDRTVTLLGRRVDLRIWPSQFRWVFGDGSEVPSASPGAPYPDLLITHKYLHRGGVNPRVDTTYSARFRVDGGAWRDVAGTVTIPGEPVALRVITATPVLVGSD